MLPAFVRFPLVCGLALLPLVAVAHPLPDIPITSTFSADGKAGIHVVVDPRCFAGDPNMAPYLLNKELAAMKPEKQAELKAQVAEFLAKIVTFHYEPAGAFKPTFALGFASVEDKPLLLPDDPVMVVGDWQASVPPGTETYQINVTRDGTFAVLFYNYVLGQKIQRFQVLFPGEESFKLSLRPLFDPTARVDDSTPPARHWSAKQIITAAVLLVAVLVVAAVRRRRVQ